MHNGTSPLERVDESKYLGIRIKRNSTFGSAIANLCLQSNWAQSVLDFNVLRHPERSFDYILRLFDILIRPILIIDCEYEELKVVM